MWSRVIRNKALLVLIHSYIFQTCLEPFRVTGMLECHCQVKVGYTVDVHQSIVGQHRDAQAHTLTFKPEGNLESSSDLRCIFLDCGRK